MVSVVAIEAQTIVHFYELANQLGISYFVVESVNQDVVTCCKSDKQISHGTHDQSDPTDEKKFSPNLDCGTSVGKLSSLLISWEKQDWIC